MHHKHGSQRHMERGSYKFMYLATKMPIVRGIWGGKLSASH